jgi:DNA-binding NtrC family response regulator
MVTAPARVIIADASSAGAPLTLAEVERRHIAAALERNGWHQGRAAGELGISVKTLYRKIREYGFERPGARAS